MAVRGRFKVHSKTEYAGYGGNPGEEVIQESVKLTAAGGPGNEEWSAATPSGTIEMTITNRAALDQFHVGQYVFVTFEPEE
jgi:hypothetical protein